MREILFRGKRKNNGEWVYGYYVSAAARECILQSLGCLWNDVIPETVGQYIGLTDKNGKKIFEGDIVKISFVDGIEIGAIGWSNLDFRFKFASPDGNAYGIDCLCDIEVIGNIHDNPELLKGGE